MKKIAITIAVLLAVATSGKAEDTIDVYTQFWADSSAINFNIERRSLERECVVDFIEGRKTGRMDVKNEMMFLDKGYDGYTIKELEARKRQLDKEIAGMRSQYRAMRSQYLATVKK